MTSPSERLSLPKDRIKVLLLEGINDSAVELLEQAGYSNLERLPKALSEPNDMGELWDTNPWREVLGGRSVCADCDTQISPWDNIPIVSWLVLRGRCRSCATPFGVRLLVLELLLPLVAVATCSPTYTAMRCTTVSRKSFNSLSMSAKNAYFSPAKAPPPPPPPPPWCAPLGLLGGAPPLAIAVCTCEIFPFSSLK